jgi:hypothetical protein
VSFGSDMRAYAEKQKRNLDEVVRESLVDLSASVIIKTPVATGVLANSWRPTNAAPSSSDTPFANSGSQARAVEAKLKVTLDKHGVYYLVNNQPYARPIEYFGHSDKAPGGMLRVSIENYQRFIDNAIDNLN